MRPGRNNTFTRKIHQFQLKWQGKPAGYADLPGYVIKKGKDKKMKYHKMKDDTINPEDYQPAWYTPEPIGLPKSFSVQDFDNFRSVAKKNVDCGDKLLQEVNKSKKYYTVMSMSDFNQIEKGLGKQDCSSVDSQRERDKKMLEGFIYPEEESDNRVPIQRANDRRYSRGQFARIFFI